MQKPNFGDTVIVKFGQDHKEVLLEKGKKIMNRFGAFPHDEIVLLPYGSKLMGKQKFGYLLKFSPILWSKALSNRTQIIYPCDMSLIIARLNIVPGSIVVESGTGSGCLSHGIINALAPLGHLYTFEYNENRFIEAKKEFANHKLSDLVTVTHQDVCLHGFDITDLADSVFLDLPSPWECIRFAKKALRKDALTRICIFSPCIEQIQQSCKALSENGFSSIKMFECLMYDHSIRPISVPDIVTGESSEITMVGRFTEQKSHTSFLLFAELEQF
eukprot:NODE_26_length_35450_cov_0.398320.p11 type:complete len:273 gc:universal NODE_26_length_35450_cov_0.398320:22124-22942(+)